MDSGRDQEPTHWQWVCTTASGLPCFRGYDVPDTNSNELRIESGGMILPGDYAFKVQSDSSWHFQCLETKLPKSPYIVQRHQSFLFPQPPSALGGFESSIYSTDDCPPPPDFSQVVVSSGSRNAETVHRLHVLEPEQNQAPRGRLLRACSTGIHCIHVDDAPVDPAMPLMMQVRASQGPGSCFDFLAYWMIRLILLFLVRWRGR